MATAVPLPDDRQLEWVALASPAPGRSFLPYVESTAAEVRRIIDNVTVVVDEARLNELYAPRAGGLGFTHTDGAERLGRAIVAGWLCGVAVGGISTSASLQDAEAWFLGSLRRHFHPVAPPLRAPALSLTEDEAFALLPYVLDRHRPGTRRELLRDRESQPDRRRRKRDGVYYTPADVADTMTRLLGARVAGSVLDPSCGTGVFLRAAVERGASPTGVYGIDIDEHAIEAAAFVVLAAAIRQSSSTRSPWAMWHELRLNLACMNSLLLERGSYLAPRADEVAEIKRLLARDAVVPPAIAHQVMPRLAQLFPDLEDGADVVLSNPPYAPLGRSAASVPAGVFVAYGNEVDPSHRAEAAFVECLWKLTAPGGAGSLVLPLSVASSSRPEFIRVRQQIEKTPGRFSFAMFDRAPDALFGDDVKTRNVILLYESDSPGETTVRTTSLLRWTSRNRAAILRGLTFTPIEPKIATLVPKVGTQSEANLYGALRSLEGTLRDSVASGRTVLPQTVKRDGARTSVFIAPTAYNWIGVARDATAFIRHGHSSTSAMLELTFPEETMADAGFAVISSKFLLWLWRAESDGFHVTTSFVLDTPFSLDRLRQSSLSRLSRLGATLWDEALRNPTISVNRSRTTVAYATSRMPLADLVDDAVAEAFGLPPSVSDAVRGWHDNLLIVDFSEERRVAAACVRRISA